MPSDMLGRMACALAAACRIPVAGRELVPILGSGEEADNLEALEQWVRRQLMEPDDSLAILILNRLLEKLEVQIASCPEGCTDE